MDRYSKITMIGKGTFGSAWLVESKLSGCKYAVKELSVRTMPVADRHLVLNEVKILSTLKHKNIIRYKNAFEENSNFYIVMEYAEGGDLYTKIKQSKNLFPQEQIFDWFTQLLLALKHIHGQNILHRDLKTQNIFLTRSDVIKLGDFGIARILDSTTDHAQTTVGTPYYLSPEICQRQPYNQKSDMWALGCVMYEITALKHPFTADCFSSLVVKILHGKYSPIPSEYGPLLEDLIAVLLRSKPEDRPSAKQLIYVPALKKYVEKYAVFVPREKMDSTAAQPDQSKMQNQGDETKRYSEIFEHPSTKNLEQVKCQATGVEKDTNKRAYQQRRNQEKCSQEDCSVVKVGSEKAMEVREKAYSTAEVNSQERMRDPTDATGLERRAESVSCARDWNRQDKDKSVVRPNVIKRKVTPVESSAANNIRTSILKEHERRRHCSNASGGQALDVEINSNQDKTKARCKARSVRIYSDVTDSYNNIYGVKKDSAQDKNRNRKLIGVREKTFNPKIMEHSGKSNDISVCTKKPSSRCVLSKESSSTGRRRSCSVHTHDKNEENRKRYPVERDNTARLLLVAEGGETSDSSDTASSSSDEDHTIVNASARSRNIIQMKPTSKRDGVCIIKSRDRTASAPCVREARARRRAARESLNYHMNHCRRLRAKSNKSASCETLNKENLYPGTRKSAGSKASQKSKVSLASQEKHLQDAMVEPSAEFKRCQTYKVAHFRRLPLMSVPHVSINGDSEVASDTKIKQSSCSTRHRSDSTFVNPKLSITKFHGLKAAHIDRARRRAKRMSLASELGSSRREFSANPDSACALSNKSLLPKIASKIKKASCPTEALHNKAKAEETKIVDGDKGATKMKFKFQGETLHLNTTDAKSAFAHMEALRVFLEENLGTRRFIDAYQYLNDSFFLSEKEKNMDSNIQHILGKENLEYLPLLHQLIASETNHFGTRV